MPKNNTGGNKAKKGPNKRVKVKKETPYATEDGMMYAQVIKNMGAHMRVLCNDNVERNGKISGKMHKRQWIHAGDVVLVSLRGFETNKTMCDILHCYKYDEAKSLLAQNEIIFKLNKPAEAEESTVRFTDEVGESSDEEEYDPLGEDDEIGELDIAPKQTHVSAEPTKRDRDKKRGNDRDNKSSRLENQTHGFSTD